jgi:hypothetical protein
MSPSGSFRSRTEISLGARGHGHGNRLFRIGRDGRDHHDVNVHPFLIADQLVAVLAGIKTKPSGRGLRPRS